MNVSASSRMAVSGLRPASGVRAETLEWNGDSVTHWPLLYPELLDQNRSFAPICTCRAGPAPLTVPNAPAST